MDADRSKVGVPIRPALIALMIVALLILPGLHAATVRYTRSDDMVSAHTIYVEFYQVHRQRSGTGLPTDFAAIAGYFEAPPIPVGLQRECVLWFNGKNLDHRPGVNGLGGNAFPSDEDEAPSADPSRQDYDFDRDVQGCPPEFREEPVARYGNYAVVVEEGDCDPKYGRDFRFRGHLDFVDPNGIYHEVQEYSYVCEWGGPEGLVPNPAFPEDPSNIVPDAVRDLFPGLLPEPKECRDAEPPQDGIDPENGTVGEPLVWLACQQRIQNLFTELLWISPVHAPVWDPTIQHLYTFALQVDTCDSARCTNGSPHSFDDTTRGTVVHRTPPSGPGDEDIMRGNSYDFDPGSPSYGMHRENCRNVEVRWRQVTDRPGPQGDDCYPEDHKTARVDVYVYDHDPTRGLFDANANGMTGVNAYTPSGTPTGPTWLPP